LLNYCCLCCFGKVAANGLRLGDVADF